MCGFATAKMTAATELTSHWPIARSCQLACALMTSSRARTKSASITRGCVIHVSDQSQSLELINLAKMITT